MKKFFLNNFFLCSLFFSVIAGCMTGAFWKKAMVLEPLGTVFINLMFCVVVPLAFFSIASAIGNMTNLRRAGKLFGATIAVFLTTAVIAAVFTFIATEFYPIVVGNYQFTKGEVTSSLNASQLLVNFFTKPDFTELFSRRAILPLVIAAILFGFGIQISGGAETMTAKLMKDITNCLLGMVKIITYYAPIGFFGFFASMVASFGTTMIGDYGRTLLLCYVICFLYMFLFFPLYAWLGGGKEGVKLMMKNIFTPAITAFGTCSSIATLPANLEAADKSGIDKEVANTVLPLGATMHMDGSSIAAFLKILFLFGIFGQNFTLLTLIEAVIVSTLASVAMSGIPGGGGTGEMVVCALFFPDKMAIAFPIAIAIGNLVDPPTTMINAAGDYVVTFLVSRLVYGKDWLARQLGKNN